MMTFGLPNIARADSKASAISSILCPSISMTCQFQARHLSDKGSRGMPFLHPKEGRRYAYYLSDHDQFCQRAPCQRPAKVQSLEGRNWFQVLIKNRGEDVLAGVSRTF